MIALCVIFSLLLVQVSAKADPTPPKVIHATSTCIWNGSNIQNEPPKSSDYLLYNGPANKLIEGSDLHNLMHTQCPQYIRRGEVCCTLEHAKTVFKEAQFLLDIVSGCNACRKNIISHICAANCDPDQSLWMDPTPYLKYGPDAQGNNVWYMTDTYSYVETEYADEFYKSCKDIKAIHIVVPPVTDPLMWLERLTGLSIPTNYFIGNDAPPFIEPFSFDFIPCNSTDLNDQCNCEDCNAIPCIHVSHNPNLMMVIKARQPKYLTIIPYGVIEGTWTFGPVFDSDVVEEVFFLQNHIASMEVPFTDKDGRNVHVKLGDICHKPLAPNNTNCTIMSVLNYFQNSWTNLHRREEFGLVNYTYHIHYCTRNPSDPQDPYFFEPGPPMSCLGAFGGPIDPNVVLGGIYVDPESYSYEYNNATSLIITIPISDEQTEWGYMYAWVQAFLDYIGSYKGDYIEIVYYTN